MQEGIHILSSEVYSFFGVVHAELKYISLFVKLPLKVLQMHPISYLFFEAFHRYILLTGHIHLTDLTAFSFSRTYYTCNSVILQDACETLCKRLEPFKAANPKGKWADWVRAAYCERVSLSATGFYR